MKKYDQIYYRALAILLLMFTGAILVVNFLTPSNVFSESENRMLQQLPNFSLQTLRSGKFTSEFETYLSDQFMERDFWIGLKSDADRGMGKKESNGVYIGKDGYLIQKFSPPEKGDLKDRVKAIQAFDKATPGLRKYMMLVPTAAAVLEDKLPPYASGGNERVYWEKIKDSHLGDIRYIDVSPALEANKEQPIYYKTDHHWTTKGAFLAYRELSSPMSFTPKNEEDFKIRQVTSQFYGSLYSKSGVRHIQPDSIELYYPISPGAISVNYVDEQQSADSMYAMENLEKKDKYTVFFNGNHGLIRITTDNTEGRRLLIVKDSYANSLIPFLTPHFSEIDVIDLRYYEGDVRKLTEDRQIHDMLIVYNTSTFFEDPSIKSLADSVE
ncbi:DHHW family protein [Cohnella phaseoli]|uniref:DHHW motif protein n=1 Tax=Cohnella phaseoli TaxID=456490 RepID=A0A3D9JM78_9BACL|nr:DHHW family protein [Cohnella phaseoli]RED75152.1 DHHW motif protein [Cohnella phaseoli]